MNIRPYQDKDYDEVKVILQQGGHFDDVWDSRSHWKAKSENDSNSILIAENDDGVLGCILIIKDKWTCFLFRLAVIEDQRGKGIGSSLISHAEEMLKKDSEDEVAIFVNEDDAGLQQYYEKRGYLRGGKYRCLYKKLKG
ncbi:MAG: GNAT family N-acetyltransferase [Patescibacteria group bacterium]|nr:GNAT family N-acetyltransferase [Patescibacteria group bacterium]